MELADAIKYGKIDYLSQHDYYQITGKSVRIHLTKGQKFKILQYRAEGQYLIEFEGEVYGADCSICDDDNAPETEWWVKVIKDSSFGWVFINKETVEFLPREF